MAANEKTESGRKPSSDEIQFAIREHSRRGKPESSYLLRQLVQDGAEIPYELLDFSGIKSEKPVTGKLEAPPRTGRGSALEKWMKFAAETSDLDMAVLEKMTREEIIEILESRKIIPVLEDENGENESEESK